MYIITLDKQVQNLFINGTQAGSMCINDTIMQYSSKKPFFSMQLDWTLFFFFLGTECGGFLILALNIIVDSHFHDFELATSLFVVLLTIGGGFHNSY